MVEHRVVASAIWIQFPAVYQGEAHGNAKLVEKQVIEIRKKYKTGNYTYGQLAKIYSVDLTTIGFIVRNETWKCCLGG